MTEPPGEWSPVSGAALAGFSACVLLVLWLSHTGERWVFLLDNANLAFHEAGHPLFGLLGDSLVVYGGTLGQLMFPLAAGVSFYRQKATLSLAFAILWFGENLFNIARYMADARAQVLPLAGNGEHDWTEIFTRWGCLAWDGQIAGFVRVAGWALIVWTLLWLWRRRGA